MKSMLEPGNFKPTPSRGEAKSDATTRLAREIMSGEANARIAKTERLRAARLAQEVAEPAVPPVTKKTRGKRAK